MHLRNALALSLCAGFLVSCGSAANVRETLGLNRKAPDEFRVYSRPSLTVPPEFNLRAPGSASDAPTTLPAEAQARSVVLGTAETNPDSIRVDTSVPRVSAGALPSGADAQFLQNAGAHTLNQNVRDQIQQDAESGVKVKNDNYLINTTASSDPTVDASKESERLKQNKAGNKSPVEGETPVVHEKGKGILGTIGDWF